MLKLKLQYFGHLMQTDSLEKTLMLSKTEGRRRRGQQRMRWYHRLNGHEFEYTLEVGNGQGGLACCSSWDLKESDMTEWLNCTELRMVGALVEKCTQCWGQGTGILFFAEKARR